MKMNKWMEWVNTSFKMDHTIVDNLNKEKLKDRVLCMIKKIIYKLLEILKIIYQMGNVKLNMQMDQFLKEN